MGWIYLAALEEFHSDFKIMSSQSPIAKSTDIVKEYSYPEFPTDHSLMHRFGITSKRCPMIGELGQGVILSTEDFHAKISVLQDLERAWRESEADFFSRSCAWPKKSSPHSYSLKMCPQSQAEVGYKLLEKLPRWGVIVDGALYPLHPLEPCTKESGGFYWPTAQARAQTDTPSERNRNTPCLETQVKLFATPVASHCTKNIIAPCKSVREKKHGEGIHESVGRMHPENIGKKLCPRWVSCLMGYPIKWTDCEPWVMQWFHSKSKQHLKS